MRFRRLPRAKQHDVTDCGAACLNAVARFYGRRVPIARIRQSASTDRHGTNVLGMVRAAEKLGFAAKGVRAAMDSIEGVPLPAIAHVVDGSLHHYLVIYAVRRESVVIMDPRDGTVAKVPRTRFAASWSGVLVLLVPHEGFDPGPGPASTATRLWRLIRPHGATMAQALVGAAIYTILGLSTAIYVQKIVDHVLVDGNRNLLNLLGVAMLALLAAQIYVGSMKSLLALRTGHRIDAALVLGYYRHLLRLPQRFFDTMRIGEVVSRVGDAVKIRSFVNDVLLDLLVNVLVVVFSFAVMFAYSWKLALVVLLAVPLYALVLWVTNATNRRVLRSLMERGADLESGLVESIGSMATIKRFDVAEDFAARMERRFVRLLRSVRAATLASIFSSRGTELVSRLAVIAMFWIGGILVIGGELTPGELMSFYALVGYLTGPVTHLVGANRTVQEALIAADRLFEIMDLEREEADGPAAELPVGPIGDIRFDGVRFRYGSRGKVFDGLDLVIPAGRMTAIVGESGSGKSTLAAILQKLHPIEDGTVRIGPYDLRDLSNASVRRGVAAVPQDGHLFAGTIVENVAIGDPEPDMARLLEICEELNVTSFVRSLPFGFHTVVGENGVELSGGQRQRLAIARALYRRPSVLILDEATSNLDSIGERLVQRCLRRLRDEGTTVIVIAHRLATVAAADRIVVLDRGRVVEEGGHRELLEAGGKYAALWRWQMNGEAGGDATVEVGVAAVGR